MPGCGTYRGCGSYCKPVTNKSTPKKTVAKKPAAKPKAKSATRTSTGGSSAYECTASGRGQITKLTAVPFKDYKEWCRQRNYDYSNFCDSSYSTDSSYTDSYDSSTDSSYTSSSSSDNGCHYPRRGCGC